MARKGENIFKRKDGRWEARYIKGYESSGKAVYGYVFGSSYLEAKRKRQTASGGQHISRRMFQQMTSQQTTSQQMERQVASFSHAGISSRMMKSKLSALKKGKKYGAHINVYNISSGSIVVTTSQFAPVRELPEALPAVSKAPFVADLALQWLEELKPIRKKSTIVKYEGQLRIYILPFFGDKRIDEITNEDFRSFSRFLFNYRKRISKRKYVADCRDGRDNCVNSNCTINSNLNKVEVSSNVPINSNISCEQENFRNTEHLACSTISSILARMKAIRKFALAEGWKVNFVPDCIENTTNISMIEAVDAVSNSSNSTPALEDSTSRNISLNITNKIENGLMIWKGPQVLSRIEELKLINYLQENFSPTNFGILLALLTGIRLGELCALRWSDFSFEEREFKIERTMQRLRIAPQLLSISTASTAQVSTHTKHTKSITDPVMMAGNTVKAANNVIDTGVVLQGSTRKELRKSRRKTRVEVGAPKSQSSIRTIPIPEKLMKYVERAYEGAYEAAMEDFQSIQDEELRFDNNSYILTGKTGNFVEPRTVENRFKAVLREAGIRNVNFHTLRHTFATRCVELGFDLKVLSEILGHSNVSVTLNQYVHPSMRMKHESMNKIVI